VERGEYHRLAAAEDQMWWFRGLHRNLIAALAGTQAAPRVILDAGCGTGGLLRRLREALPHASIVGLDIDGAATRLAQAKGADLLCVGSVDRLPFADGAFDAICSADVLCHNGVDERAALAGFQRCLKPGGMLVLNLPAYRWLYSAHDAAVDNAQRYNRKEVARLLATAGFSLIRARYWNTFLFPLMVLRRKLWHGRAARAKSDVALLPRPVEKAFGAVMAFETRLLRAGVLLPFGGSILAVGVKP
jgi:SAM-dependent methyltransferase